MIVGYSLLAWLGAYLTVAAVFKRGGEQPGLRHELPALAAGAIWLAAMIALFSLATPAHGHSSEELDAWRADWNHRAAQETAVTVQLMAEYLDMTARHANPITLPRQPRQIPDSVEHWRPLVAAYFHPANVDAALAVLWCESRGNPNATHPTSGAAGLFQHLPTYWAERSNAAGIPGANIYDPDANVRVAGWLSNGGKSWTHWVCQP